MSESCRKIYPIDDLPLVIPIGVQSETGVEEIRFDVKPWMDAWDGLEMAVCPTRPGESAAYPAADVELVGSVLYWRPNDADTAIPGDGTVEVVGITADKRKLSGACKTICKPTSLATTQEPPEGIKPYYDGILEAAAEVKQAAEEIKGASVVIYPDATLSYFPDDGAFLITTPWEKTITAGGLYTVKYNGAEYDCRAVTMDNGVLVLGKASQLGLPGGNEDAPFVMMVMITDTPDYTADGLPIYGAVMPLDGATELTLGITYKERDQITLIVGTDGTVTSDTPFEKAWTMTDAELAAAIAVQDTGTYYGMQSDFYSSVNVRRLTAPNGYKWLQIAYVKLVDHGDLPGQADVTRYIDWIETAITLSGHQTQSLPDMTNLADKGKYYMCCINGAWVYRSLDDLKADLGLA